MITRGPQLFDTKKTFDLQYPMQPMNRNATDCAILVNLAERMTFFPMLKSMIDTYGVVKIMIGYSVGSVFNSSVDMSTYHSVHNASGNLLSFIFVYKRNLLVTNCVLSLDFRLISHYRVWTDHRGTTLFSWRFCVSSVSRIPYCVER